MDKSFGDGARVWTFWKFFSLECIARYGGRLLYTR